MKRWPPPKFIWFLVGGALVALAGAHIMPSVVVSGINSVAIARLLLSIAFILFTATLLELAIIYVPGLTGSKSRLFAAILALLLFAGWAVKNEFSDETSTNNPPPRTRDILSSIFPGSSRTAPIPAPKSESTSPADTPPTENTRAGNSLPQPRTEARSTAPTNNPRPTTAARNLDPDNVRESDHEPPPTAAPARLPTITAAQRNKIRDAMRPYAGLRFTLLSESPTTDSREYADQIERALTGAGLVASGEREEFSNGRNNPPGLSLVVGEKELDAASRLSSAMRRAGLITWSIPILETSQPDVFQLIVAPN